MAVGGYLRVELAGRTQRQEIDDLFYVCLSHVKVVGVGVQVEDGGGALDGST